MEIKSIYDVTVDGYRGYGAYVNNNRHIPLIFDGLKPSYRRTIYGALVQCGSQNRFIKTANLAGYVIGNLHPHGDKSITGVISELVNAGILEGQGNFGGATVLGDVFEAAAPRYTEVRVDPKWHSVFNELLPYVEWESSYNGTKMPSYLPTPIPLSLLIGSIGIGFGVGCLIPNFSAKSLIEAFKKDDPYELVPNYRDIKFDYSFCDFENMWSQGYATLSYIPNIYKGSAPDCRDGIYIRTDARFIVPNLPWIQDKVNAGRLFTRDESDLNGDVLFIGRYPSLREDMDAYVRYALDQCRVTEMYRLYVTDGTKVSLISLRNWIKFTYTRYLRYIESMKQSKINRISKEIRVLNLLPKIAKLIQDNPKISESEVISNFKDEQPADIKAGLSKPIRKLMRDDFSSEINSLNAQLDSVRSIDPDEYTDNILSKM